MGEQEVKVPVDDVARLIISVGVSVVFLDELDRVMAKELPGDALYPTIRPLIAAALLYSTFFFVSSHRPT